MNESEKTTPLEGTQLVIETSQGTETYDSRYLVAALLIYIARGSGSIEPEESAKMIDLLEEHFHMGGSESLELLTRAMSDMAGNPELGPALIGMAPAVSEQEKEEIALMSLKVIAADGRRNVGEMEKFNEAVEALGISPESVHRAFDRYFAETMPGS